MISVGIGFFAGSYASLIGILLIIGIASLATALRRLEK